MESLPLATKEKGRGTPPVLLLHGFTGSAAAWGERLLEELAAERRVLAVDLPGHGQEARRPPRGFTETLDRIEATLDDHGVERADWVGYSMGGRLALAGAIERPTRVRRLVLESASPGLATRAERDERRRRDEALADRLVADGIEAFVEFWESQPLFLSQRALPAERLEISRRLRLQQSPTGLAASLRNLGTGVQPSYWGRLREVRAETLVLAGSLDEKFRTIAHDLASGLGRARSREIRGVGHAIHLESPDRWLEEVRGFLDERTDRFASE